MTLFGDRVPRFPSSFIDIDNTTDIGINIDIDVDVDVDIDIWYMVYDVGVEFGYSILHVPRLKLN